MVQVLLFPTNSSIIYLFALNDFEYWKWLNVFILLLDGTQTGTTTLVPSETGSNCNEGELHIPQSSSTGPQPSHAVYCHIRTLVEGGYLTSLCRCSRLKPRLIGWIIKRVKEYNYREILEKLWLTISLEKSIKADLIETFKVINGIFNYDRYFFQYF